MRINQVTRGRTLRASTRIAALLGAAALAAGPAIAYAETQPPSQPGTQVTVTAQESASASPTDGSTIPDPTTVSAEPTVIVTQPSIPDLPTPTQSSDGGVGGGDGTGTGNGTGTGTGAGSQDNAKSSNNKATSTNTTAKKSTRSVTTTSANASLPNTGSNISTVVILGAVLTAGGVGLVATARRRRAN